MCGIFGLSSCSSSCFKEKQLIEISRRMLLLAESRGKDASGIGVFSTNVHRILKKGERASRFVRTNPYRDFIRSAVTDAYSMDNGNIVILTHARLATNGVREDNSNNSPVKGGKVFGVHNGIIVNSDELLMRYFPERSPGEVDSRVLFLLMDKYINEGRTTAQAAIQAFEQIEGSVSIAAFSVRNNNMVLGTNTGSLYTGSVKDGAYLFFASESLMLRGLLRSKWISKGFSITKLSPGSVKEFNYNTIGRN